jgi:hypothetical protein
MRAVTWAWALVAAGLAAACGASGDGSPAGSDGGIVILPGVDGGVPSPDGGGSSDAATADASTEAGGVRADRFITTVVSFTPGPCAGFGTEAMLIGPPEGGGLCQGSTDVLSLGNAGTIVVSFAPNAIVDGPGTDFLVFENPFAISCDPNRLFAEPGEVSVSDDGVTWKTYACTATQASGPPYGQCAGWHVVQSNARNGVSPVDPAIAGGDPFDLADVGMTHARYVRVVDHAGETCPSNPPIPNTNGFDLDAMAIVNAEIE